MLCCPGCLFTSLPKKEIPPSPPVNFNNGALLDFNYAYFYLKFLGDQSSILNKKHPAQSHLFINTKAASTYDRIICHWHRKGDSVISAIPRIYLKSVIKGGITGLPSETREIQVSPRRIGIFSWLSDGFSSIRVILDDMPESVSHIDTDLELVLKRVNKSVSHLHRPESYL